jgi:hypothetical protein
MAFALKRRGTDLSSYTWETPFIAGSHSGGLTPSARLCWKRIELVFYDDSVTKDRDRLTSARIAAITQRHVHGRRLTGVEEVAALAEVADGRIDLLAEQAGLAIGFHDQDADSPEYLRCRLC